MSDRWRSPDVARSDDSGAKIGEQRRNGECKHDQRQNKGEVSRPLAAVSPLPRDIGV